MTKKKQPRRSRKSPATQCFDCDRPYGDQHGFPDLLLSDSVWKRISPTGGGGGLLCPSCICKRLYDAGMSDVEAAFMSGPIRAVDPLLLSVYVQIERLRRRDGLPPEEFVRNLIEHRRKTVTLREFSRKCGLSQSAIKKLEVADPMSWGVREFASYCFGLDINADFVLAPQEPTP